MARKIVVEIDDREKNPLLFPEQTVWSPEPCKTRELLQIETKRVTLDAGDYRLADYPESCVIERKGSLDELAQNLLTKDRTRFANAFIRFVKACRHPVLVVEAPASCERLKGDYQKIVVPDVLGSLHKVMAGVPKLTTYWVGSSNSPTTRAAVGSHMVRLMMAFAQYDREHGDV